MMSTAGKALGRVVRGVRRLFPWGAGIAAIFLLTHTIAGVFVDRVDAAARRDPSGILVGAEELSLGPEDSGTATLLIHGFLGGGSNFGELPTALATEGIRVRVMRLPGHGTSPRDLAPIKPNEFISSVLKEVRQLKVDHEQVVLVGFSMGGTLATITAAIEEVDGLVLAAPYYRIPRHWYYLLPVETWSALTSPFVRWTYKSDAFVCVKRREAVPDVLSYRWVPSGASRALFNLGRHARDPELLETIESPILWIHSPDDRAAGYHAAESAVGALDSKSIERIRLSNSDHHVFHDYERAEVIAAIVRFVKLIDEHPEKSVVSAPSAPEASQDQHSSSVTSL